MTKADKGNVIEELTAKFNEGNVFYITDSSTLNVAQVNNLRELCYKQDIELRVAKNTLIKKAMEASEKDFEELYPVLSGPTSIMFAEVGNAPAKLIEDFRKSHERPILKGASVESAVFIGDEQLESLAKLKSKEELIGEIIALLNAPAKNLAGALQSAGAKLAGALKTISEKDAA